MVIPPVSSSHLHCTTNTLTYRISQQRQDMEQAGTTPREQPALAQAHNTSINRGLVRMNEQCRNSAYQLTHAQGNATMRPVLNSMRMIPRRLLV